jgi:hypothetical protein
MYIHVAEVKAEKSMLLYIDRRKPLPRGVSYTDIHTRTYPTHIRMYVYIHQDTYVYVNLYLYMHIYTKNKPVPLRQPVCEAGRGGARIG